MMLVAAGLIAAFSGPQRALANGTTRQLTFYEIHNKETTTVVFKKNGKFIPAGLKKFNWVFRDWRRNTPTKMDPKLIDLIWEIHTELGSKKPVYIISGYRSAKTNAMLRRRGGGQAKKSQHILGKAADVHFPDIPLKKLRYSALVRERGGVGYYPTSAIPFVHIDTGRPRHWPNMPRYELALLFPKGRTKHRPRSGGPIRPKDVRIAKTRYKKMAVRIAKFHEFRKSVGTARRRTLVASAAPSPAPARRPRRRRIALAAPTPAPAPAQPLPRGQTKAIGKDDRKALSMRIAALAPPRNQFASAGRLTAPRLARRPNIDRSSQLTKRKAPPRNLDRDGMAKLSKAALNVPNPWAPTLLRRPKLIARGPAAPASGAGQGAAAHPPLGQRPARQPPTTVSAPEPVLASLGPTLRNQIDSGRGRDGANTGWQPQTNAAKRLPRQLPSGATPGIDDAIRADSGWGNGWVVAPAFDDEHPEELSYRPFPIVPLLTASASADDPALARLSHPDAARTLELLDEADSIPAMQFLPRRQRAQAMWTQQFSGSAVSLNSLYGPVAPAASDRNGPGNGGLNRRRVATTRGG